MKETIMLYAYVQNAVPSEGTRTLRAPLERCTALLLEAAESQAVDAQAIVLPPPTSECPRSCGMCAWC